MTDKQPKPVCGVCNDSHRMWHSDIERYVPCTHCPLPCSQCAPPPQGLYCAETPCPCECHCAEDPRP